MMGTGTGACAARVPAVIFLDLRARDVAAARAALQSATGPERY